MRRAGGGLGVAMTESAGEKLKTWRADVKDAASRALEAFPQWNPEPKQPFLVELAFFLPRPKSHFGTGRNAHLIKASAPALPTTKPDIDKLERSTLDALKTAGIFGDDAQVVRVIKDKLYADGRLPGATIRLVALPITRAEAATPHAALALAEAS